MSVSTEHHLAVESCNLFWDEWQGGDELVVLLHGSGVDASTWTSLAQRLSPSRTVLSLDRRGYGRSEHPPIGDHRLHRADALAVLDEAIGRLSPAAVHLVGWSSGGVIALDIVADRPELASTITVLEAPVHGLGGMTPGMLGMMARVNVLSAVGRRRQAAAAFYRWAGGTSDGSNLFDEASEDLQDRLLSYSDVILRELRPSRVGSLGEHVDLVAVGAAGVPVTWLLGGRSKSFYRGRAENASSSIASVEVVDIPGGTHFMHLEQEDAVVAALERAFSRGT